MAKRVSASKAPDMFLRLLQHDLKGLEIVKEHRFCPSRRWRFDYAIIDLKIAVEVDGAVWVGGRHNRAAGYVADMEKLNIAASMGWLVLRITTDDRFCTKTMNLIKSTVEYRRNEGRVVIRGADLISAVSVGDPLVRKR